MFHDVSTRLFSMRDDKYGDFHSSLIPNILRKTVIGVRMPLLRAFAKELSKDQTTVNQFLATLPHRYLEEYTLHALLVADIRDFPTAMAETERLMPFIDNWAVCDVFSPKAFAKEHNTLYAKCLQWLASDHTYTVRFGIVTLMRHFLDKDFHPDVLDRVSEICSDEYYINMAVAWFFCDALIKQWDSALPYLQHRRLTPWTHNKTISKCIDSYRISPDRKEYLKTLKISD